MISCDIDVYPEDCSKLDERNLFTQQLTEVYKTKSTKSIQMETMALNIEYCDFINICKMIGTKRGR